MNTTNAHLYLPLVKALAEGRTIEIFDAFCGEWEPDIEPLFVGDITDYRIKPEPKTAWYRVAETTLGLIACNNAMDESLIEYSKTFKRWLDTITYDVTE